MPTTSPFMLNSGPPELPGLMATSVWMKGTNVSCGSERPLALTMPAVTELSKPKGEPMATTHSPTRSLVGSPIRTAGRPVASILIRAMSVRLSAPMTLALNSRLSPSLTRISSADSTTWALVST
ncbi:MAG: putative serine protease MucD domain protein [Proteobacteria bacterium]|nr:putative serine protease MucD domain protein [Pseudomonadota bacterium]